MLLPAAVAPSDLSSCRRRLGNLLEKPNRAASLVLEISCLLPSLPGTQYVAAVGFDHVLETRHVLVPPAKVIPKDFSGISHR